MTTKRYVIAERDGCYLAMIDHSKRVVGMTGCKQWAMQFLSARAAYRSACMAEAISGRPGWRVEAVRVIMDNGEQNGTR